MRALPILIVLLFISKSLAQITNEEKNSFLYKLFFHSSGHADRRNILAGLKSLLGAAPTLDFLNNLVHNIETGQSFKPEEVGGEIGMRAVADMTAAYNGAGNQAWHLEFLKLTVEFVQKAKVPSHEIWSLFKEAVRVYDEGRFGAHVRFEILHGTIKVSPELAKALDMPLSTLTAAKTTEATTPTEATTDDLTTPTTEKPTEETTTPLTDPPTSPSVSSEKTTESQVDTSTDAPTVDPNSTHNPAGGGQKGTSYPPIDPAVLASLRTAGGHGIKPDTLPDGTLLSNLTDHYAVYNGVDDWSKVVANKHGYFVIHPVQTKDSNTVVFDPYTIGQVLGYIYEYEEFKGVPPKDGWTIELMGKKVPTAIKRSSSSKSRRATLVFTKKSEEHGYWKNIINSSE